MEKWDGKEEGNEETLEGGGKKEVSTGEWETFVESTRQDGRRMVAETRKSGKTRSEGVGGWATPSAKETVGARG